MIDGPPPRLRASGGPARWFPHLEGAGKQDAFGRTRAVAAHATPQQAPRARRELVDRLRDGGQIGAQRQHPVEVVEADDRHVARDVEPEAARRLEGCERADVGQREDRGGRVGAAQLGLDRAAQALEVVAAAHEPLVSAQAGFRERAAAAGDALGDVAQVLRMGEERDVAMAEADEVAHGLVGARLAIGAHRVEARRFRAPVHEDGGGQRRARPGEGRHRGVARRHRDEAVDAPPEQGADAPVLDRGVLAGRHQQEIVAVALGDRLDAVDEAGEEHVGDVGDDHADEAGRRTPERARGAIDPVAEVGDGFEDAAAAGLAHGAVAVHDVGRRRHGYPGACGYIPDGGRLPQARVAPVPPGGPTFSITF